jgi:hypothetical protein
VFVQLNVAGQGDVGLLHSLMSVHVDGILAFLQEKPASIAHAAQPSPLTKFLSSQSSPASSSPLPHVLAQFEGASVHT